MKQIKRNGIEFAFGRRVVIMSYGKQYIAFHAHGKPSKRALFHFTETVSRLKRPTLNTVFRSARHHDVQSMAVSKETLEWLVRTEGEL